MNEDAPVYTRAEVLHWLTMIHTDLLLMKDQEAFITTTNIMNGIRSGEL